LSWDASGTAGNRITIAGYPGSRRAVVVKTKLKLVGDWLTLRNLVVDRNSAYSVTDKACTGDPNVNVYGAHASLIGLEIRNSNMSGIYLSGADRVSIAGNWIHDNGTHRGQDHGIYFGSGNGGSITDNIIDSNGGFGIHMYPHPTGQLIAHNTVVGSSSAGIILSGARDLLLVNNIFAWNAQEGIRTHGDGCSGCAALNNLVYGNEKNYYFPEPLSVKSQLVADPRFVDRQHGDYRLRVRSPAINAAIKGYARRTDFEGKVRRATNPPDVGALER
jgi:parallel beta-helix repeat protein